MDRQIKVAGIIEESIVDGPGIRMVIFAQGCNHKCKGCQNPQTHAFSGGSWVNIDDIISKIKKNTLIDGVTLSGGEPFEQAEKFSILAEEVKKLGLSVITYTGYTYEKLLEFSFERKGYKELLNYTDLLVDGPFVMEEKNLLLKFRGSKNQRIIDVPRSINNKKVALAAI